jgi:hypothetical protein
MDNPLKREAKESRAFGSNHALCFLGKEVMNMSKGQRVNKVRLKIDISFEWSKGLLRPFVAALSHLAGGLRNWIDRWTTWLRFPWWE